MRINSQEYWDLNIAKPEFGLRQQRYLELAGRGKKIVELGCGMSPFLDVARICFSDVWGVDFSPETVKEAAKEFPDVKYMKCNALSTPFRKKYFDVSVAGELIEHLPDPKRLVEELVRITKRRIIISTAQMEYREPEHLTIFTEKSLAKLFKPYGKVSVETIPSDWFPGRKYLFLTCDLND